MKRVFICSPFKNDIKYNTKIAKVLCKYAISQGYAPFAPHLFYPRFMSEKKRDKGIECGLKYLEVCDELWYTETITDGMNTEIKKAQELGLTIDLLRLYFNEDHYIISRESELFDYEEFITM